MCGICCFIVHNNTDHQLVGNIETNVKKRGPDCNDNLCLKLSDAWLGYFCASVLWTQGTTVQPQPVQDDDGNVLLWNGDVFSDFPNDGILSDSAFVINYLVSNENGVLKLVNTIKGPYSFIFWESRQKILWFGRDKIGRHSLLWSLSDNQVLLTSVGHKSLNLMEVPAVGIFSLRLDHRAHYDITLFLWSHYDECMVSSCCSLTPEIRISEKPISGLNLNAARTKEESSQFYDAVTSMNQPVEMMNTFLESEPLKSCVQNFLRLLAKSVRIRVIRCPKICIECKALCNHCKVAILFSGGLDSTVLALLANRYIPQDEPIDLLNVAFRKSENSDFNVPDRLTGLSSLQELRTICPERTWNFVEVNVPPEELAEKREDIITHLIHPLDTILDESLGCALWFASRGKGLLDSVPYTSPARILLSGMGADEQLGGYARHRSVLKKMGWKCLGEQLLKDTLNIWQRNLGRDDRVISDHGRQPRFPYLDEDVVDYLNSLPPWFKCGPSSLPIGYGDKLLLRLAAWNSELRYSAVLPKRALQFGSRIANSKEKGNATSERL